MTPPIMLVASDGQWVLPDSSEFFAALGDSEPDYDSVTFAVKNLGFIKFQFHDQSLIEIELHPRAWNSILLLRKSFEEMSAKLGRADGLSLRHRAHTGDDFRGGGILQ